MILLYYGFSRAAFGVPPRSSCIDASKWQDDVKVCSVPRETRVHLGNDEKILVVPAVPSVDITTKDLNGCRISQYAVPDFLRQPLLKKHGEQSGDVPVRGYHSGRRSALVHRDEELGSEGDWYRLKGCGDLEEGITVREVEGHADCVELRGVQFLHTSARELYMTTQVNNALLKNGLLPANEPAGYWQYDTPEWPVPCTCDIFKTHGDRRLNDHILLGLEMLLPHLVNEDDAKALLNYFPESRRKEADSLTTWFSVLGGNESELLDLRSIPLREHAPPHQLPQFEVPPHAPELETVVDANCAALEAFFHSHPTPHLLAHIYWRLGWDAGRILRTIHDAKISWGTFTDKLGVHCNAHPNNFILLPPQPPQSPQLGHGKKKFCTYPLLAPLDFDLAFTEQSVASTNGLVESFSKLIEMEVSSMRLAIAGDAELNSGSKGTAELSPAYQVLKWGLRDTLVKAFNTAYNKGEEEGPIFDESLYCAGHVLLQLALLASKDVVA